MRFQTFPQYTTILKLCGDILLSNTVAVTQKEIEAKAGLIEPAIRQTLRSGLIIVGFTPLDDEILRCFPNNGGTVHFIGTKEPSQGSYFKQYLGPRNPIYIIDEEINFDIVFQTLAIELVSWRPDTTSATPPLETTPSTPPQAGPVPTPATDRIPSQKLEDHPLVVLENDVWLINTTVLTITMEPDKKVHFEVRGESDYTSKASKEVEIKVDGLAMEMASIGRDIATYHRLISRAAPGSREYQDAQRGRDSWRPRARSAGENLYEKLLIAYPELHNTLAGAIRVAETDDTNNLTLVFAGSRNYLVLPYELLPDANGSPLVVRYPLCRKVNGVGSRYPEQQFDAFVQKLVKDRLPLKVLLIASGTPDTTCDAQVSELEDLIKMKAGTSGIRVDTRVLVTAKATSNEVEKQLSKYEPHIVHYAGHGTTDEATAENSGLMLWENGNKKVFPARKLASLLSGNKTRLFFVNACLGAWTGGDQLLNNNDFLGIIDALVQAGVPYALGYRWYVTDSNSRAFAKHFYDHLFTPPFIPERAVWHARRKIYEDNGNNETWASPILVAQKPYS